MWKEKVEEGGNEKMTFFPPHCHLVLRLYKNLPYSNPHYEVDVSLYQYINWASVKVSCLSKLLAKRDEKTNFPVFNLKLESQDSSLKT